MGQKEENKLAPNSERNCALFLKQEQAKSPILFRCELNERQRKNGALLYFRLEFQMSDKTISCLLIRRDNVLHLMPPYSRFLLR